MKCVSWNCRGVGSSSFRRNYRELLARDRPDILCLVETKAEWGVGTRLARKLRFDGVYEVAASGFVGGLILLWHPTSVTLNVVSCTDQCIHTNVTIGSLSFLFSFVYVQPNVTSKDMFWDALTVFASSVQRPWVVMGDFNDFALLSLTQRLILLELNLLRPLR